MTQSLLALEKGEKMKCLLNELQFHCTPKYSFLANILFTFPNLKEQIISIRNSLWWDGYNVDS